MTIFRRALSDQRGIALPLALAVLFVVAGLAAVAARGAINASHQTYRDSNVKRAFQAANGGIDTATYQQLREHLDDRELLELGAALSVASGWQRFIEAFGIRPDSWTEAMSLPWHEGAL